MKTTQLIIIGILTVTFISCGRKEATTGNKVSVEKALKSLDSVDNVLKESFKIAIKKSEGLPTDELINSIRLNTQFYKKFPAHPKAPFCLDKVQGLFGQMNNYQMATAWSDTLLDKYPKYENRAMILESQASNYDMFLEIRDTSKVRKFYTMLLIEFPKMEKDKKANIEYRLKNLNLTFEELIVKSQTEKE